MCKLTAAGGAGELRTFPPAQFHACAHRQIIMHIDTGKSLTIVYMYRRAVITGRPNWPVLFCSLASVVVCRLSTSVTLPAAGRAGVRAADTPRRASSVTSR